VRRFSFFLVYYLICLRLITNSLTHFFTQSTSTENEDSLREKRARPHAPVPQQQKANNTSSGYSAAQNIQIDKELIVDVIYPNASSLTDDETYGRQKEPSVHVCFAPPGPLGLVVDTTPNGPIVHSIKPQSPLMGILKPGDFVLAVDSIDTTSMNAATLTKLMAKKANQNQRKITYREGNQGHTQ
jgi:C-terminal processing protease CtpA/Prc